jgi:hypothetical protein
MARQGPWQHPRIEGATSVGEQGNLLSSEVRQFAIEVFRTILVEGYSHPLAGVEQLKNQSYLWELRGLSTLEVIKGCSSWGLIARIVH